MINNSWEKRKVDVLMEGSWAYRDEIAGRVIEGKDHLVRELNPKSGTILTRKR
jgi:hypothetical protein